MTSALEKAIEGLKVQASIKSDLSGQVSYIRDEAIDECLQIIRQHEAQKVGETLQMEIRGKIRDALYEAEEDDEINATANIYFAIIPYLRTEHPKVGASDNWRSMDTAPTETGTEILAIIMGCETGRKKRVVLERVNESDCEWRFDGSELSNAWDIVAWLPLAALSADKE